MEQVGKKKLVKNYIYNLISQILILIIPLITSPYLARVLHEEGTGQLSYSNSIVTYFILLANLGFSIYGQREVSKHRDDQNEKSKIFFEVLILKSIFTAFSLSILFTIIFTFGFGDKYNFLIELLSISVLATLFDLTFYFQGVEDFRTIAIRSILVKIIGMVFIFVLVKTQDDLWIYALCTSLTTIVCNVLMWPKALKSISRINIKELNIKRHIKPSFFIFLPTLAVTIYSVLDKTMIGLLSNNPDYDNGCYDKAYQINSMALLLVTVISPIMIPRNAYEYGNNNMDNVRQNIYFVCNYVWLIGLPLVAGFGALSWNLSSWFLGEGFTEVPLMMIIMSVRFLSSGFTVTFGDQFFIIAGKEKYCTISTLVAAVINFGLNFLFIPWLGAIGAAITTAIAEVVVTIILALFIFKEKVVSLWKILLMSWKYLLSAGIMFVCIYFIQRYLPFAIWSFIVITIVGGVIYFLILLLMRDNFLIGLTSQLKRYLVNKFKKGQTNG